MGKCDLSLERQWGLQVRKHEKSGLTIHEFCTLVMPASASPMMGHQSP